MVFRAREYSDHEQVLFCRDASVGLAAIIAIHDRTLGPAVGGCRMYPYASEDAALIDVLRLSRGMTYKSALAGLPFGGGKSVILGDPEREKTHALLQCFAGFVDALDGRYIAAEDSGVRVQDILVMREKTRWVAGRTEGPNASGDPSPFTARGVHSGIRAAVQHKLGTDSLAGVRIAVQGVGSVGWELCRLLHAAGAELVVADVNARAVQRVLNAFRARSVGCTEIHAQDVEVFAPCALGSVLDDETVPDLKARIIAGAANNQLAEFRHGEELRHRGILYAPDYVINAGGIINGSGEILGHYDRETAVAQVDRIGETLAEIFRRADAQGKPTHAVADEMAEARLAEAKLSAESKLSVEAKLSGEARLSGGANSTIETDVASSRQHDAADADGGGSSR